MAKGKDRCDTTPEQLRKNQVVRCDSEGSHSSREKKSKNKRGDKKSLASVV
jgi:hypothetical protein